MRNLRLIAAILSCIALSGCLKDKGNYDYSELNAPKWDWNYLSSPIYITSYAGDTAKSKVPFHFEGDSAKLLSNVRYEWRFKGILLSEERNFWMPTDQLIEKLGLPFSQTSGSNGSFSIIDKTTGVKHMARTWITIRPKFYQADWLILSEDGANSKLSFYKKKVRAGQDGKTFITYTLHDNLFEVVNSQKLMGAPKHLRWSQAQDISVPVGATSVITSQSGYIVNNENFKLVSEYKDEFLDGAPSNLKVENVFHSRLLTFVANDQGQLYQRVLSPNWLGGKFISDPYLVDEKGYKVKYIGVGKTANYPNTISPCYDELNRRVMMFKMAQPYRILPVKQMPGVTNATPVWNMPQGTEVLYIGASSHIDVPSAFGLFTMVYNDANGNTFMSDFVINQTDGSCVEHVAEAKVPFPGGNIPKGTKFLGTADSYKKGYFFYTKGKELRMINRVNNSDKSYMTFDHNITDVKYASYNINYKQIALGFDNGDFFMIDVSLVDLPKIMPETKVNVKGKIADIMEIRIDNFTDAY